MHLLECTQLMVWWHRSEEKNKQTNGKGGKRHLEIIKKKHIKTVHLVQITATFLIAFDKFDR